MPYRQQSLDKANYSAALNEFASFAAALETTLAGQAGDVQRQSETLKVWADQRWQEVQLRYSAGEDLRGLAHSLTHVIEAYERYVATFNSIEREVWDPPFSLRPFASYAQHLEMFAALVLFRREDLIPRFFSLNKSDEYHGIDSPFEKMREFYLPYRNYFGDCRWPQYKPLIHALKGLTSGERSRRMAKYVKGWHKSRQEEGSAADAPAASPWAMCAAAFTYLFDIDDSKYRSEAFYPKDLVDYARSMPRAAIEHIDIPGNGIHVPRDQELNSLDFVKRRRQPFLPEQSYLNTLEWFENDLVMLKEQQAVPDASPRSAASGLDMWASTLWDIFEMRYTAGEDLSQLALYLTQVVEAYERADDAAEEVPDEEYYPLIILNDLIDVYIEYLNLLSAAVLLHREDLIPRIFGLIEGTDFDASDAVIEDLLGFYLPDRPSLDGWHWKAHTPLLDAIDAETPDERAKGMAKYVGGWYNSLRGVAIFWNKHEQIKHDFSPYKGYWAMCAAAFSYLYDIDDSSYRDNMVYPKDMIDYARSKPRKARAPAAIS